MVAAEPVEPLSRCDRPRKYEQGTSPRAGPAGASSVCWPAVKLVTRRIVDRTSLRRTGMVRITHTVGPRPGEKIETYRSTMVFREQIGFFGMLSDRPSAAESVSHPFSNHLPHIESWATPVVGRAQVAE